MGSVVTGLSAPSPSSGSNFTEVQRGTVKGGIRSSAFGALVFLWVALDNDQHGTVKGVFAGSRAVCG